MSNIFSNQIVLGLLFCFASQRESSSSRIHCGIVFRKCDTESEYPGNWMTCLTLVGVVRYKDVSTAPATCVGVRCYSRDTKMVPVHRIRGYRVLVWSRDTKMVQVHRIRGQGVLVWSRETTSKSFGKISWVGQHCFARCETRKKLIRLEKNNWYFFIHL